MRARKMFMVFGMVAVLGLALAPAVSAADLIVVATKETFAKAEVWVKFLDSKKIPVKNVEPSNLAGFKDATHVILMGGMDEAAFKPLAEKALSKSELSRMNMAGSSAMYVKSDVWKKGQEVIVFAGATESGVDTARKSNRAEWMDIIFTWFGLEVEATGKGGTPSY